MILSERRGRDDQRPTFRKQHRKHPALSKHKTRKRDLSENSEFAIYQIMGWKHRNIIVKATNSPTQGQPNPRKNGLKSGIWATFSHSKYFFVGWDWFYIGNRLQETQSNRILRKHPDGLIIHWRWGWGFLISCVRFAPNSGTPQR